MLDRCYRQMRDRKSRDERLRARRRKKKQQMFDTYDWTEQERATAIRYGQTDGGNEDGK